MLFLAAANSKIFECCEWACTLRANGIDGYYGVSLAECEYYTVSLRKYKIRFNFYYATSEMFYLIVRLLLSM